MVGGGLIVKSLGLGVGLAMDAFSVSIADGLADPKMSGGRKTLIAGTFAAFQFLMPVIGWLCVHTIARHFAAFEKAIPWIALILLAYIGGKMLVEGVGSMRGKAVDADAEAVDGTTGYEAGEGSYGGTTGDENGKAPAGRTTGHEAGEDSIRRRSGSASAPGTLGSLGFGTMMAQGVATSIDALSVGFAFASLSLITAIACSVIIGVVTFVICILGLALGNQIGSRFTGKAEIVGGAILIFIGLEIWIRGVFL